MSFGWRDRGYLAPRSQSMGKPGGYVLDSANSAMGGGGPPGLASALAWAGDPALRAKVLEETPVGHLPIGTRLDAVPNLLHARSPADPRQELFIVGVRHFNSYRDPQAGFVSGLYGRFVKGRPVRERSKLVSVTEGAKRSAIKSETPSAALRRDGEQAFHTHLAAINGVDVMSGEPPYIVDAEHLLKRFEPELVEYFYYMRFARQYRAAMEEGAVLESYDAYVRRHPQTRALTQWLEFRPDSLLKTHQQLYPGTPLDPRKPLSDGTFRSAEYYESMFFSYPEPGEMTPLRRVQRECHRIREKYLFRVTESLWNLGYSPFITYGQVHVAALGQSGLGPALGAEVRSSVGEAACRSFLEQESGLAVRSEGWDPSRRRERQG